MSAGVPANGSAGRDGPGAGMRKLSELTGGWTGVTTGDFDGDGRLDLVASNWGQNTRYEEFLDHGSGSGTGTSTATGHAGCHREPLGRGDEGGCSLRDLRAMRSAIPDVGDRFKSHREYARASLTGIFGKALEALPMLEIRMLELRLVPQPRGSLGIPAPAG